MPPPAAKGELQQRMEGFCAGIVRMAERAPDQPLQEVTLLALLKVVRKGVRTRLNRMLEPWQLSASEFRTLGQLFVSSTGRAYPTDLCRLVAQTPANMSHIVETLSRRKFITRTHSGDDRRRVELRITAAGRKFVEGLLPERFALERAFFAELSASDKRALTALLQKVLASIDRVDAR